MMSCCTDLAPSIEEHSMTPFKQLESQVQSYARSFPVLFTRAQNAQLFDAQGRSYLDRNNFV